VQHFSFEHEQTSCLCEGEPDAVAEVQEDSLTALNSVSVEDSRLMFTAVGAALGSVCPVTGGLF
jgi:hypothetical protein